ncbi:preprotein translocase subunit SecE [Enterobacteriaceae endosymbiont of Plateumaris consimilis]|uniref:preprotein translocase subunit SecE n=1 Tax=Enterobacteriaceae endosymbiont of Plateumaris consimilis TaxID=2675794 RepID=UPI0014497790|nr:preprotein translocase subunit SecE [Enterobacteriaceae endosymbiont of Plateumaris consimilis]QJC28727.1 preprotein translocase subunit SecE [Enterobacteriaceae endosymbiont of Plateumaris consimilis]
MINNVKFKRSKYILEYIKWTISIVLFISIIICDYLYQNIELPIRIIIICPILILIVFIILSTKTGKKIFLFIRETRIETRKVIWPSYKETLQITLIIIIITLIISLIIWCLDSILIYLISFLTNMRL